MSEKVCPVCHKALKLKEAGYPMGSALLKADRVHVDIYECPECQRVELFAAESDLVKCPKCGTKKPVQFVLLMRGLTLRTSKQK